MTKKELMEKKITELRSMAKKLGLVVPRTAKKEEVASLIVKTLKLKELRARKKIVTSPPKKKRAVSKRRGSKTVTSPPSEKVPEIRPVAVFEEKPVELPQIITRDLLGIVPVSPTLFYLYWEISRETAQFLRDSYLSGEVTVGEGKFVIRIYDLTGGREVSSAPYFDLRVFQEQGGFHIDMGRSGEFYAEFGVFTPEGKFIPFVRSNIVRLPKTPGVGLFPEAIRISFPSGVLHPTSL